MERNPSHQKKTPEHIREYSRAIKRQQYEPTVNQALAFNDTTNPGEDLTQPVPEKRRPINIKAQIEDYVKENWIPYAFGIFVLVAGYFMIDSKIDLAKIFETTKFHTYQIDGLKDEVKDLNKKAASQDLKLQENQMRVQQLEQKGNSSKSR